MVALPIVVPLLAGALSLAAWRLPRLQRALGVLGPAGLLVVGAVLLARVWSEGPVELRVGGWPAPHGIGLAADGLSAVMVVLAGLTGTAAAVYATVDIDDARQRHGFYPLLNLLLVGVSGAFVTSDLFNLYVWFEVMLIASFVLVTLGGERAQLRGGIPYVVVNLVSSAVFLLALGGVYGTTGTLDMGELGRRLPELMDARPAVVTGLGALLLVTFGVKAGLFPLYAWLPAAYPTPPAAVSALFAGLLTKVGVYSLLRVFVAVLPSGSWDPGLVGVVVVLTMMAGVLGAVSQKEVRRILSFHSVSQIGYMVAALGIFAAPDPAVRRLAIAAAIVFLVHHNVVKANLFLVSGAMQAVGGTTELARAGGLAHHRWLAVLFLIPALSLAGVPPLSGFWAKFAVIDAAIRADQWLLVAGAAVAGLLTLVSMVKIWTEAFWKPRPGGAPPVDTVPSPRAAPRRRELLGRAVPIAVLALITVLIGLYPQPLFAVADLAAGQLLAPGGGP